MGPRTQSKPWEILRTALAIPQGPRPSLASNTARRPRLSSTLLMLVAASNPCTALERGLRFLRSGSSGRLPRMTLKNLMILVAVVGIVLTAARAYRERKFSRLAAYHAQQEAHWRRYSTRWLSARRLADYHGRMRREYQRATALTIIRSVPEPAPLPPPVAPPTPPSLPASSPQPL